MRSVVAGVMAIWLGAAAMAGPQPDEILDDPALEARARALSADLRCMVCRNESIDESNADLARDMRLLVRERLLEGDDDAEVLAFVVDRYGEFVLLRPTTEGANMILWISAPVMLLLALISAAVYLRRRESAPDIGPDELSEEERARLDALLKDRG
ncbi:cytochrome c-type biogenesis protein CcmH [Rhodobacteraceae bacterium 2376]|uniref:Cytochrome c-type biogenesis protein n=1 Tax=Rhabdonatronobacter sediminivivens TaxID=2743469 RepID=A0A7Z0HW08_9RHOB|nr:cytochrome c-type biogenesis protein [Rhabdonatronobacter sediminivivens]NYS23401.1 cytochrome c-type biogenesis protein CcmH [Rhabdonatronobacter sediminivivens]